MLNLFIVLFGLMIPMKSPLVKVKFIFLKFEDLSDTSVGSKLFRIFGWSGIALSVRPLVKELKLLVGVQSLKIGICGLALTIALDNALPETWPMSHNRMIRPVSHVNWSDGNKAKRNSSWTINSVSDTIFVALMEMLLTSSYWPETRNVIVKYYY